MPEIWEGKKYTNYESENFDEYMKELGVGWFLRKLGNNITSSVELRKLPNNKYKLITRSVVIDSIMEFELGKEFDETTLDDREVKSVVTMEGNKLFQQQKGDPPATMTLEFFEKEMICTMTVRDVVCIRKYRVVDD